MKYVKEAETYIMGKRKSEEAKEQMQIRLEQNRERTRKRRKSRGKLD
jgi:hypothetical protein